MLHGATPVERLSTFYTEKTIQILSLCLPPLLYFWIRLRYYSFATGLLIGGSLINLLFLLWSIFGL